MTKYISPEVGPAEDEKQTGLTVPNIVTFRCTCGKESDIRIGLYREREKELVARIASAAARIQELESALDGAANYLAMLVDDHREIRFARGEEAKARSVLKVRE